MHTRTLVFLCIFVSMCVFNHVLACALMYVCMYVCSYVQMNILAYVHMSI